MSAKNKVRIIAWAITIIMCALSVFVWAIIKNIGWAYFLANVAIVCATVAGFLMMPYVNLDD